MAEQEDEIKNIKEVSLESITSVECIEQNPKMVTLAFCFYIAFYWTLLVILPSIIENSLRGFEFWFWVLGMIGACSLYYAVKAGKTADSRKGKPILAYTALIIGVDWSAHAYLTLDDRNSGWGISIMFCHAGAILWATLFFYKNSLQEDKLMAWLTLGIEWIDLIFMCIAIVVLDDVEGDCLNSSLCVGYYVILVLHVVFWFSPIMFGKAETARAMHIHMIVLDSVTDLPLVIIVMATAGYEVHGFIFADIALKLILLLRSYGYHGIFELCINAKETDELDKKQRAAIEAAEKQEIEQEMAEAKAEKEAQQQTADEEAPATDAGVTTTDG